MGTFSRVVVSNRLPVHVVCVNGELSLMPSGGGLATAISSLSDSSSVWVGWPGIAADDLTLQQRITITAKLRAHNCYPVFLTRQQLACFYDGYSNDTIWPLFHYFQSLAVHKNEYWDAYKEVNQAFANVIASVATPNATVWIHDYHLMLLPQMVREALPAAAIGFFLHIPFPSSEIFRQLPNRQALLLGLLGADIIGFHVYDYARHFLSSVLRVLGHEHSHGTLVIGERVIKTDVFPIGVDYANIAARLHTEPVQQQITSLDQHYNDLKMILSMDRLDYSKGILNRLTAYELFLRQNPEYCKKVVLAMVAVPSRTDVQAYQDMREAIEHKVSRINGEYGTVDWAPISYQFRHLPFDQIVAMQARADVALVTPLRDGMNLVAKEYVAAKQDGNGVLILSEMAGAIDELPEALAINPNDAQSVANAIKTALDMPPQEQRQRLQAMQRRLRQYNVQRWATDFMQQLALVKQAQAAQNVNKLSVSQRTAMRDMFVAAPQRMLFLDYDGTLRTFVKSPDAQAAAPTPRIKRVLQQLASQPNTTVCVVSGRPREALDLWFANTNFVLVAEHGAWTKQTGEWTSAGVSLDPHRKPLLNVLQQYAERTPGAIVEEKSCALVWHYRNVPTELAYVRNASLLHELHQLIAGSDLQVFYGNKILEIKPRSIHKGRVVQKLLANNPASFVMAVGDDYTDEYMFEALPDTAYTIKVGHGDTHARHQVASVDAVAKLLEALASL